MKKKVLVVLLALVMVITMFAACGDTSKTSTPESTVASSVESSAPSVSSVASSVVSAVSSVASTTSSVASTTSSAVSTASTTSTASKATSSKTSTAAGTSKIGSNPDYNLPVSITIVQEMHFGDSTEYLDVKKDWEETLSARYGVKIHEDCITKTEVGTVYQARLAAGELTGVVYNYGWGYMFAWFNENAVYPLDEYLKNNKTWNMLPKEAREAFKIGNQIWAVPNGWKAGLPGTQMGMWTQAIRNDWLKKLGFADVGYTLDVTTFKDIVTAFGSRSSELGVTGIIPIIFGADLWGVWNIFNAFDAFIFDPLTSYGYTFNPDTGCFEDALLREGGRKAIEYIRYFYANNLCPKTTFDNGFSDLRNTLASAKVGAFCLYQGRFRDQGMYTVNTMLKAKWGTSDPAQIGDGYSEWIKLNEETWVDTQLIGTKSKGLFANSKGAGGYCLMVGTPQPAETINFFVDLLYSSATTWFEARYNLLGKAYIKESDGTYTRKYYDKAANKFYPDSNLCDVVETELYPAKSVLVFNEGQDKTAALKRTQAMIAYNSAMTQAAITAGRIILLDDNYKSAQNYSPTYVKHSGEILSYQSSFIYDGFMKTSITIDKLFASYKKSMAAIGGDKVLKEVNQAWGWVNDYQSYT